MDTNKLPDYPSLLKEQYSLLSSLCKIESLVEMLLAKDLADSSDIYKYLYEYFFVISDLLIEAKASSESLSSYLLKMTLSQAALGQEI